MPPSPIAGFREIVSHCKFQFDFTGSAEALVEKIRSHVSRSGGQLMGSATEGSYSLSTPLGAFRGTFSIAGQLIFLEVLDKPFFVTCGAIEARLANYVKEAK
ncbi:MAG: hypothetical protein ACRD21_27730 [Vicinamibacteria bacterium]